MSGFTTVSYTWKWICHYSFYVYSYNEMICYQTSCSRNDRTWGQNSK
jgi:hypothetical protein